MSKILKNTTGSPISISDTGITLPASPTTYTIPPEDYLIWAASSDIVTEIGSGNVVVNDGSNDLTISDGVNLIKGIYPTTVSVNGSEISIEKGPHLDAFNRFRVSNPTTIFQYNNTYNVDFDLYWSSMTENGGTVTHDANRVCRKLSVTTTSGSKASIQTRRRMQYSAGKSHCFKFTGNANGLQTGVRKRLGLFDSDNGFFLEGEGGLIYFVIRSKISGSVVDTKILRDDWNVDSLDGTGPSGITLTDFSRQFFFQIDYAWLGAGKIRLSVMYQGKMYVLHEHTVAFELTSSYSQTPNLPFRSEIEVTGTPLASDYLEVVCLSFDLEGNEGQLGKQRYINTEDNEITLSTSSLNVPIMAIRIDPNYKNSSLQLQDFILTVNSGNSTVRWEILLNPTISGSPTWSSVSNSVVQQLVNPTTFTVTGGTKIDGGYARVGTDVTNNGVSSDIYLGRDLSGNMDTLVFVGKTIASNSKILATVKWKEYH